jgi:hypothetical protein
MLSQRRNAKIFARRLQLMQRLKVMFGSRKSFRKNELNTRMKNVRPQATQTGMACPTVRVV